MEQSPVEFLQSFMEQNRYFIGNDLLEAFNQADICLYPNLSGTPLEIKGVQTDC